MSEDKKFDNIIAWLDGLEEMFHKYIDELQMVSSRLSELDKQKQLQAMERFELMVIRNNIKFLELYGYANNNDQTRH